MSPCRAPRTTRPGGGGPLSRQRAGAGQGGLARVSHPPPPRRAVVRGRGVLRRAAVALLRGPRGAGARPGGGGGANPPVPPRPALPALERGSAALVGR